MISIGKYIILSGFPWKYIDPWNAVIGFVQHSHDLHYVASNLDKCHCEMLLMSKQENPDEQICLELKQNYKFSEIWLFIIQVGSKEGSF